MPRSFIKNTEFKEIRTDLKDFLRDPEINPEFTDIDFEGSNINVIINLLSYVAHHHAVYSNLVLNESFLRTAHTRASTVSRAKDLGYTPRSKKAATMIVDFTMRSIEGNPSFYTLTRGTKFTASVDGQEHVFVIPQDVITFNTGGEFHFNNLRLVQGKMRTFSYNVTADNVRDSFEIPDLNADVNTLQVFVKESNEAFNGVAFRSSANITDNNRESSVYYLQEGPSGKYEIEFGDDILSQMLKPGNVIKLNWVSTKGPDANGISFIRPRFEISGGYDYDVNVASPSYGGEEKENIDSIKFTAPKIWAAQNRVVTIDDYYAILRNNVGDLQDLNVWGGDEHDPPQYGKVFMVLETKNQIITQGAARDIYQRILKPLKMPTIIPEIVLPNHVYLNADIEVTYDPKIISLTKGDMQESILHTFEEFVSNQVQLFDNDIYLTELEHKIFDNIDRLSSSARGNPIKSIDTGVSFTISKPVNLVANYNEVFDFINPLKAGSLSSNHFTSNGKRVSIVDDEKGRLKLFDEQEKIMLPKTIGFIDYEKGKITTTDLIITEVLGSWDKLFVTVKPKNPSSFEAKRETIFRLGDYYWDVANNVPNPTNIKLSIV